MMLYLRLFYEFFKTGLFTIGGGMATVPFLYKMSTTTGWFSHNDVAEGYIFHESRLTSYVSTAGRGWRGRMRLGTLVVGDKNINSDTRIGHNDVRQAAVSYYTVLCPSYTHARRVARQVAIGDSDVLAHLVLRQGNVVCTNNDTVITAGDV